MVLAIFVVVFSCVDVDIFIAADGDFGTGDVAGYGVRAFSTCCFCLR
jgi:hypothetical protein